MSDTPNTALADALRTAIDKQVADQDENRIEPKIAASSIDGDKPEVIEEELDDVQDDNSADSGDTEQNDTDNDEADEGKAPVAEEEKPYKVRAPSSWSPAAKNEFSKLSPAMQDAIAKREYEIDNGYKELSSRKQELQVLEPYRQLARQHNVEVSTVLDRYIEADKLLNSNPIGGIAQLMQFYNVGFEDIARQFGVQSNGQSDPNAEYNKRLQSVETHLQRQAQAEAAHQQAKSLETINAFADDPKNIYFDNVSDDIVRILNSEPNISLEQAYNKACWSNDAVREQMIASRDAQHKAPTRQPVDNARRRNGSLNGSPTGPGSSSVNNPTTPNQALLAAMRKQGADL